VGVFVLTDSSAFKPVILIPVYNHEQAIGDTLQDALQYNYPILLVDDGSSPACREVLQTLTDRYSARVSLLRLENNGGKGAAVKAGFIESHAQGYSHALQVDADGQHDLSDVVTFMRMGENNPRAMIAGVPLYDQSVPKVRYYSRYLTHVWVWINTLSLEIKDSMCGFRLYPLASIIQLLDQERCGDRMDFDTEIIVRWLWRGGDIKNLVTKVHYPVDGVSHFDALHDNFLISCMHTRLFFGMLKRLPTLLWRKLK